MIATFVEADAPSDRVFPCMSGDVPSSSAVKPRPSSGLSPSTGNGSSSRSAVKTRSGTSPPARLRLPRSNAAVAENACAPRRSAYSAGDSASTYVVSDETFGNVTPIVTTRSGSGYGNGLRISPSTRPKISVLPPMPSASESTAIAVKPGRRANWRRA